MENNLKLWAYFQYKNGDTSYFEDDTKIVKNPKIEDIMYYFNLIVGANEGSKVEF